MPDNDLQESSEIKEKNSLTNKQGDDTIKKIQDVHSKRRSSV
jgi:hypothetical protein